METEVVDRVRSWGIRYQGTTNPLEFLDKIEQWASGYGIQENQLVQTMPYILEGAAIDWWNTTPTKINTWRQLTTELLEYFLPPRYEEQLRTQIAQLKQRDSEPVREYAMGLRKLMRFTKLSEEEKLDRIFNNCRSKIKLYTRRAGFRSLTEFLKLAEEVEEIEAADQPRHNQPAQQQIRPEICMRCGGTGHAARTCGNPQRLFCWVCGRKDIRTTECCRTGPGNAGGLSR
nr:activity-regulated cytoskeleton associated protein 1-like [Drosophila kikkawai]